MDSHTVSMESTTPEEDIRQLLRVTLNREGGDPSLLLELLARVVEMRVWERFQMSFVEFIKTSYDEGGVGWSEQDVETVLKLTHRYEKPGNVDLEIAERLKTMRTAVRKELIVPRQTRPGNPTGNNQHKRNGDISPFQKTTKGSTGRDYWIERFSRVGGKDYRPEIAERLLADQSFTVKQAKQMAGKMTPESRPRIDWENPQAVASTICVHMSREMIDELISLLLKAIHEL